MKEELLAPPKIEAKAETLKAKKTVLKGIYATQNKTKQKDLHIIHIAADETLTSLKGTARRDKLHDYSIIKLPQGLSRPRRRTKRTQCLCALWMSRPVSPQIKPAATKLGDLDWPRSTC